MANQGPTSQTILVVGGGIAGITAAVEAAETGYDVILLERGPALGGRVAQLNRYFPKLCHPTCGLEINFQRIRKLKNLRVVTMANVADIKGEKEVESAFNYGLSKTKAAFLPHEHAFPMRYVVAPQAIGTPEADKIKAACKYDAVDLEDQGESFDVACGAVVWATGWDPYEPEKLESYNYSLSPDIITNVHMERLANHDGPTEGRIVRPSNGEPVKKVAMIQCAGSRDRNHLPYCSRICCLGSLKHAAYVREQYADAEVDIYYIDLRAHDKLEAFYQRVAADPQVNFIKSKPASIEVDGDGNPVLHGEDTITRELYDRAYDLVVLATGMKPAATNGYAPPVSVEQDEYGFLVPSLEGDGGIIPAGVAAGPLDVSMSVQSATAAALKAIQAVGPKS
jgi:quinone-modifying oxidoreductase subunit QmoA